MKNKLLPLFFVLGIYSGYSQVAIGKVEPNLSAQLEVFASNRGMLIPRVALTSSLDTATITNGNVESLLVFNTATVLDIKPGYYYWYDDKWNRIAISDEFTTAVGNVTFNSTTNQFNYTDANGDTKIVNIENIIKANETVTTLVKDPANDGKYVYTSEDATQTTIDVIGDVINNAGDIFNNPAVTTIIQEITNKSEGNVTFNSTTNEFSYTDANGDTQIININDIVKANETVTTLVKDSANDGKYVYTNEDATQTTIDVIGDVINNAGDIFNTPAVTTIIQEITNKSEGNVTFNSTTNEFSYTDANGDTQIININDIVKANETVTTLVKDPANDGKYIYTSEDATQTTIDVIGDVINNAGDIFNNPAVTNIIQEITNKSEGNVTFNSTTNEFSYTDANGDTQIININDIVKANETVTTLVKDPANDGKYVYTSEDATQTTIDVIGDVINNAGDIFNNPAVSTIIQEITNKAEGNVTFNSTTNEFSYTDANGDTQIININDIVKANETVTTLVKDPANDGKYVYTSEDATQTTIDVIGDVINNAGDIFNNPAVTTIIQEITNKSEGNVTFNSTTNEFSYTDANGDTQIININDIVKANETVTTLVKDPANDGKYVYTSEDATQTTIDVIGDVINNAGDIFNTPAVTTIIQEITNKSEGNVTFNSTTNEFGYTDANGDTQIINIEDIVKANETVTTLVKDPANDGKYVYTSEDATQTTIDVVGDVINNASTIFNDTAVVNEIKTLVENNQTITSLTDVVTKEKDDRDQEFDVHTLTYTDETGTANPIDLSVLVKGTETLTSLTYDGATQALVYKDEKGVSSDFNLVDLVGDAQTLTKLEVNSDDSTLDYTDENKSTHALDLTDVIKEPWYNTSTNKGATLNTDNIYTQGWVGIGFTTPSSAPNEKLRVNGAITTVNSYYADYVFEDYFKGFSEIKADYKFKSLAEIDGYIKRNNHLPGITPINELMKTKEGYAFNVSELSIQLLEKTEELYLHVIEQSKELEAKNAEIQKLKTESEAMSLRLEKLEKLMSQK